MEKSYSQAQYCMNGHATVTNMSHRNLMSDFCPKCGANTISNCPKCNAAILGDTHTISTGYSNIKHERYYEKPRRNYCHNCGCPYPWTEKAIENLKDGLSDIAELASDECSLLIDLIPDMVAETPSTPIAAKHFQKALSFAKDLTYDILTQFAAEMGCSLFRSLLGLG